MPCIGVPDLKTQFPYYRIRLGEQRLPNKAWLEGLTGSDLVAIVLATRYTNEGFPLFPFARVEIEIALQAT